MNNKFTTLHISRFNNNLRCTKVSYQNIERPNHNNRNRHLNPWKYLKVAFLCEFGLSSSKIFQKLVKPYLNRAAKSLKALAIGLGSGFRLGRFIVPTFLSLHQFELNNFHVPTGLRTLFCKRGT